MNERLPPDLVRALTDYFEGPFGAQSDFRNTRADSMILAESLSDTVCKTEAFRHGLLRDIAAELVKGVSKEALALTAVYAAELLIVEDDKPQEAEEQAQALLAKLKREARAWDCFVGHVRHRERMAEWVKKRPRSPAKPRRRRAAP